MSARISLFSGLALLLCLLVPREVVAGEPPPGLELTVEQLSPAPLPYQSVRLRFTFHNKGKNDVNDSGLLLPYINLAGLKGPKDEAFRSPLNPSRFDKIYYTLHRPRPLKQGLTSPLSGLSRMRETERLVLRPGDKISVSGVIGSWQDEDGIFQQPGEYQLQLAYFSNDYSLPAKPFNVTVASPTGVDGAALQFMQGRKELLAGFPRVLLLDNVMLGKEYVAYFKELVDQHPRSSYTYYGRYLLTSRQASVKVFDPAEDMIKVQDRIDYNKVAFGAEALLSMWRSSPLDKARIKQIEEKLQADFYDSDVWIEEQANRLTFAQLMELRKPPAERKKPQQP